MSTTNLTRSGLSIATASTLALASAVPSAAALVSIGETTNIYFNGSATARYDDNIFLQENNEESDLIFIFAPGVELNVGRRANANLNVYYREDFYLYEDNSDLDTNTSNVFLDAFFNMPRLDLRFDASFQQLIQPEANLRVFGFDRLIERDAYRANFRGEYEISERTSIASGINGSKVDFDNDIFFSDSESFSVPVTLYYALTPRFDLSAGYRYRYTDVKRGNEYDDHYANVGIRGEVFPKLMGEARVGYQERRVSGGEDDDGVSFGLDFSHFLTPKITLLVGGYRDFETGGQGQSIDTIGGSLGARYTFNHLISATAGANYFERDYETGRTDDTLDLNLGVSYSPITYVNLSAGYIFRTNDSNLNGLDFDNNIFNVSASLRY